MYTIEELHEYGKHSNNFQVENKTRQYILPSLRLHSRAFMKTIVHYHFVAGGIVDIDVQLTHSNDVVCYLVDIRKSTKGIKDILNIPEIVYHYPYGDLAYSPLHMFVIAMPEECKDTISHFKKSVYSKMYKNPKKIFVRTSLAPYFNRIKHRSYAVCTKDRGYSLALSKKYSTDVASITELDSMINPYEEIFNYK